MIATPQRTLPWPGFEPGLSRPQREVLTTIRSRLLRYLSILSRINHIFPDNYILICAVDNISTVLSWISRTRWVVARETARKEVREGRRRTTLFATRRRKWFVSTQVSRSSTTSARASIGSNTKSCSSSSRWNTSDPCSHSERKCSPTSTTKNALASPWWVTYFHECLLFDLGARESTLDLHACVALVFV